MTGEMILLVTGNLFIEIKEGKQIPLSLEETLAQIKKIAQVEEAKKKDLLKMGEDWMREEMESFPQRMGHSDYIL
jgi:hypothetical protein